MLFIDDLLMLPMTGFIGILKKIRDMADAELQDAPEKLQRELFDAQTLLETGQIKEYEYRQIEEQILKRLMAFKK
ncbi:MAG: gas vesicle protein GvpG [Candidatus Spechtbacterales bacterium]